MYIQPVLVIDGSSALSLQHSNEVFFKDLLVGEKVEYALVQDVAIELSNDTQSVYVKNVEIGQFSEIILWNCYKEHIRIASLVAQIAKKRGLRSVSNGVENYKGVDKLSQHLIMSQAGLRFPDIIFENNLTYSEAVAKLGAPFVCKDILSSKGLRNQLIATEADFEEYLRENKGVHWIAQRYISAVTEYRLLIYKEKVELFERKNGETYVKNTSQGGSLYASDKVMPESYLKKIRKSMKALGIELSGIDILEDDASELYCLECNFQPRLLGGDFAGKKTAIMKHFLQR